MIAYSQVPNCAVGRYVPRARKARKKDLLCEIIGIPIATQHLPEQSGYSGLMATHELVEEVQVPITHERHETRIGIVGNRVFDGPNHANGWRTAIAHLFVTTRLRKYASVDCSIQSAIAPPLPARFKSLTTRQGCSLPWTKSMAF